MDFSDALRSLKANRRVARVGWEGRWLKLSLTTPYPSTAQSPNGTSSSAVYLPHIDYFVSGMAAMPWSMSHEDVLAEDWIEV